MSYKLKPQLSIAISVCFAIGLFLSINSACAIDSGKKDTRYKIAEQNYLLAKSNYESALSALKAQQERVKQEKIILKKRELAFNQEKMNLNRTNAVLKVEKQRLLSSRKLQI